MAGLKSWLMEHFGFVSPEEYQLRGTILGEWAKKACVLQKKVEALERKVKRLTRRKK